VEITAMVVRARFGAAPASGSGPPRGRLGLLGTGDGRGHWDEPRLLIVKAVRRLPTTMPRKLDRLLTFVRT
jgi:hypothetical protein